MKILIATPRFSVRVKKKTEDIIRAGIRKHGGDISFVIGSLVEDMPMIEILDRSRYSFQVPVPFPISAEHHDAMKRMLAISTHGSIVSGSQPYVEQIVWFSDKAIIITDVRKATPTISDIINTIGIENVRIHKI